ncbi:hypothetical protein [Janthinobacterium agaricidamnosum]|uniref:hypothetical protein n=1 Tax=Janthinobacterium agaricidamnosum TaxID=55508 RepID=UPI0012E7A888|nr:hypothetical protein [Janthinobacterium agaricidamnosum]
MFFKPPKQQQMQDDHGAAHQDGPAARGGKEGNWRHFASVTRPPEETLTVATMALGSGDPPVQKQACQVFLNDLVLSATLGASNP